MFSKNILFFNQILVITLLYIQLSNELDNKTPDDSNVFCLQKRTEEFEKSPFFKNNHCSDVVENFCDNVECAPIDDCDLEKNYVIVEHVTGRGCCPACVQFLDEDEPCEVRSKFKRCKDGLYCNPSTKQCNVPTDQVHQTRCLIESHNRNWVQKNQMYFYIEAMDKLNNYYYYGVKFSSLIDHPNCDYETGKYELKQCKKTKCYCVNPDDGKFTFGMSPYDLADNVTCKCADHFWRQFGDGSGTGQSKNDLANMQHYAEIHPKCNEQGDFQALQCVNGTCFCVDEQTGKPLPQKGAIYGALQTLQCFDAEKAKKIKSKESDVNYQNGCEKQLLRSQSLAMHFNKKGTQLRGNDKITCSFDGKYAPRQCTPGGCSCANPDDAARSGAYSLDRLGGREREMECRCAREEYYKNKEGKGYEVLQCDGFGNFKPFQCFEDNRKCFCVDEDGGRISEVEPTACFDKFIKKYYPGLNKEEICTAMRMMLKDVEPLTEGIYYRFEKDIYLTKYDKKGQLFKKPKKLEDCGQTMPK